CAGSARGDLPMLQCGRLMDGFAAALIAAHQILRLVLAGSDLPPGELGVLGDLAQHLTFGGTAMALPGHAVALVEFLCHGSSFLSGGPQVTAPPSPWPLLARSAPRGRPSSRAPAAA